MPRLIVRFLSVITLASLAFCAAACEVVSVGGTAKAVELTAPCTNMLEYCPTGYSWSSHVTSVESCEQNLGCVLESYSGECRTMLEQAIECWAGLTSSSGCAACDEIVQEVQSSCAYPASCLDVTPVYTGYQILCQQVTCDGRTILRAEGPGPASGGQACERSDVSEADGKAAVNAACQAALVANGCGTASCDCFLAGPNESMGQTFGCDRTEYFWAPELMLSGVACGALSCDARCCISLAGGTPVTTSCAEECQATEVTVGCDGPEDCGGWACCGHLAGDGVACTGTPQCPSDVLQLCHIKDDCPAGSCCVDVGWTGAMYRACAAAPGC
jgi:hypothetical protein